MGRLERCHQSSTPKRLISVFISGGEKRWPLPITDNSVNEMRDTGDEDQVFSVSWSTVMFFHSY